MKMENMNTQPTAPVLNPTKEELLAALKAWVVKRHPLDFRDYYDVPAFTRAQRENCQARKDALSLITAVSKIPEITSAEIVESMRGKRLSYDFARKELDYTTGQDFKMEYRPAVSHVLSSALWRFARKHLELDTGDQLRNWFKQLFGTRIANRYFN